MASITYDATEPPDYDEEKSTDGAVCYSLLQYNRFDVLQKVLELTKMTKILLPYNCLKIGEKTGHGNFGIVYKGELCVPGETEPLQVAVKTLQRYTLTDTNSVESLVAEGLIMTQFHHIHVLTMIGFCVEDLGLPMVVLPFMKNGDLRSYIQAERNNESCTLGKLTDYARQIAEGMEYLAHNKFIHRDLAARNCMLDEHLIVKVADFGLSKDIYEKNYYRSQGHTELPVKWMSPESIEKGINTLKSDVWSYGIVLWELMTRGLPPYPGVESWDILPFLKKGRRPEKPDFCPKEMYSVMLRCWDSEPRKRPCFPELVKDVSNLFSLMKKEIRDTKIASYANEVHDE